MVSRTEAFELFKMANGDKDMFRVFMTNWKEQVDGYSVYFREYEDNLCQERSDIVLNGVTKLKQGLDDVFSDDGSRNQNE